MPIVLVDSNVLLDLVTEGSRWLHWSTEAVAQAGDTAALAINPIIFAEVSVNYSNIEDADAAFPESIFVREALPYGAAFLAGKVYLQYLRRGGTKSAPLETGLRNLRKTSRHFRVICRRLSTGW